MNPPPLDHYAGLKPFHEWFKMGVPRTHFGINTGATNPHALPRSAAYAAMRRPRELWLALTS